MLFLAAGETYIESAGRMNRELADNPAIADELIRGAEVLVEREAAFAQFVGKLNLEGAPHA